MTEIDRDSPSAEKDDDDAASDPAADVERSLGRCLTWLAVIAFVYAATCALSLFFGILYYKNVLTGVPDAPPRMLRLGQIFIVQKGTLLIAFVVLGRALWRYTRGLKRSQGEAAAADPAQLRKAQLSCWQAALWVCLLHVGWFVTAALVERS